MSSQVNRQILLTEVPQGKLSIDHGFDAAINYKTEALPDARVGLLAGKNVGKRMVKVS